MVSARITPAIVAINAIAYADRGKCGVGVGYRRTQPSRATATAVAIRSTPHEPLPMAQVHTSENKIQFLTAKSVKEIANCDLASTYTCDSSDYKLRGNCYSCCEET